MRQFRLALIWVLTAVIICIGTVVGASWLRRGFLTGSPLESKDLMWLTIPLVIFACFGLFAIAPTIAAKSKEEEELEQLACKFAHKRPPERMGSHAVPPVISPYRGGGRPPR